MRRLALAVAALCCLVVPVGERAQQRLQLYVRSPEGPAMIRSVPCRFVPLVGEEGFAG